MTEATPHRAVSALRRFARQESVAERCDLCSAELPSDHAHVLEVRTRQLRCACRGCALLFSDAGDAPYRLVTSRVTRIPDLNLRDEDLHALGVPVRLAFLSLSHAHDRVFAVYPNAAGATEATLPASTWSTLLERQPSIGAILPDVEGVLIDAVGERASAYHVSLDVCHRLVGLLRGPTPGTGAARLNEMRRLLDTLAEGRHV